MVAPNPTQAVELARRAAAGDQQAWQQLYGLGFVDPGATRPMMNNGLRFATQPGQQVTGNPMAASAHVPGSYQQRPPVWATDAGTIGSNWQLSPASAYPNAGIRYDQQANAITPEAPTPQESRDAGLAAIYGQQAAAPTVPAGPTPEQSRDAGLGAIYGPGTLGYNAFDAGVSRPGRPTADATVPVAYNEGAATARFEFNGQLQESPMARAQRRARDLVESHQATSYQHALEYELANQSSDFRRKDAGVAWGTDANGGLGYDPSQFVDNTYGEKYDPNKVYRKGSAAGTPAGANPGPLPGKYAGGFREPGQPGTPGAQPGTAPGAQQRADDPLRIGAFEGGSYDENTVRGWIARFKAGDGSASYVLRQIGLLDQNNADIYGLGGSGQAEINALNQWAKARKLSTYQGGTAPDPGNRQAWDQYWLTPTPAPTPTPGTAPPGTAPPGTAPPASTAPPATPTASAPTATGQGNTGGVQDLILGGSGQQSQDARLDYVLRKLGIDQNAGGLFANSIINDIQPMLERRVALEGIGGGGGGPQINAANYLGDFANILGTPGGMGQLQQWGQNLRSQALGPNSMLRNADPQTQLYVANQLLAASLTGVSPILQQAYADYFGRGQRGYQRYSFDQTGRGPVTDPIAWLYNSQWSDLVR